MGGRVRGDEGRGCATKRLASGGVDVVSCVSVNHDSRCDVSEWPVILAKPIDGPERARPGLLWGTCANPFFGPSPPGLTGRAHL